VTAAAQFVEWTPTGTGLPLKAAGFVGAELFDAEIGVDRLVVAHR
jgi:hypothetical protein